MFFFNIVCCCYLFLWIEEITGRMCLGNRGWADLASLWLCFCTLLYYSAQGLLCYKTTNVEKNVTVGAHTHTTSFEQDVNRMDVKWEYAACHQPQNTAERLQVTVLGRGEPACPNILAIEAKCFAPLWLQATFFPSHNTKFNAVWSTATFFDPVHLHSPVRWAEVPIQWHPSPFSKWVVVFLGFVFFHTRQ